MKETLYTLRNNFYSNYSKAIYIAVPFTFPLLHISPVLHRILIAIQILLFLFQIDVWERLKKTASNKYYWICLGMFILPLLWLPFSNTETTFFLIERMLSFLIYATIFFCYAPVQTLIHKSIEALIIGLTLIFFLSIISNVLVLYRDFFFENPDFHTALRNMRQSYWWNRFSHKSLVSIFRIHPSYIGMYLAFCIMYLSIRTKKNLFYIRRVFIFILPVLIIFQMLLAAKMAVIATILCLVAWALHAAIVNKKRIQAATVLSVLLLAGIGAYSFLPAVKDRFTVNYRMFKENNYQLDESNVMAQRVFIWHCTLNGIMDKPILGQGPDKYQSYLDNCSISNSWTKTLGLNVHNQFLQVTIAFGIIGAIVFLAYFVAGFYTAFNKGDHVFGFFLLTALLCFQTESMLSRQMGIIYFAFFFVSFMASNHSTATD